METKLPIQPDKNTIQLLIRAKEFLEHAIRHSKGDSELDIMVAVHGLDNSIEYIMRILVYFFDVENENGVSLERSNLQQIVSEINKLLKNKFNIRIPYSNDINLLRQTRNLVQHYIMNPDKEIDRLSNIAEKIFDFVLRKIFGLEKENLFYSSLINDPIIYDHIIKAENKNSKGAYLDAIVSLRDAFENSFYKYYKTLDIKLASIPAVLETEKTSSHLSYFLDKMTDEIILSRLSIDSKQFRKFQEYLDHIPGEYSVKKYGYTLMQRPWNRKDFNYCYQFVMDFIIKLQNQVNERLYKVELKNVYSMNMKIGKIDLSQILERACGFMFEFEEEIEWFYADGKLMNDMRTLKMGKIYSFEISSFENNILKSLMTYKGKLLGMHEKLVTNNPERWEVMIWYNILPLTWKRIDYENSEVSEYSLSINTDSAERICEISNTSMELAEKVVALRKALGKIKSKKDLKKIDGITEEQIFWLTRYAHI